MSAEQGLASWLQLSLTPGIGPARLRDLLTRFGLPEAVVAAGSQRLSPHLPASAIDALSVSTQKGLLGLYGMGYLYVRREWAERMRPAYLARFGVDLGKADVHESDIGEHAYSLMPGARRFDLGRYRKEEKPAAVTFDTPGVIRLYCEIHDHMRGTILVLDTPYFTSTDHAGRYRLTGLPAGRYVLKAWIDENDVRELPVELRDGAVTQADFPRR